MNHQLFAFKVVNVKRVGGLPDHHRVACILKDIEKFSEDQVAQILDNTRQAAKNRVHQARLVIRKRVEDRFFKTRVEATEDRGAFKKILKVLEGGQVEMETRRNSAKVS